ncbi:hypothetical protein ABTC25_18560, partial [Acinetobacter baumannii]
IGDFEGAEREAIEVRAATERLGFGNVAKFAVQNLGIAHVRLGRVQEARARLAPVAARAEADGDVRLAATTRVVLARGALDAGDLVGAAQE